MTWRDLLDEQGSVRRLLESYWKGSLEAEVERFVEQNLQPETIIGYKPITK